MLTPFSILNGLSNSQNLSNASNAFLLFVGCVSIFLFVLVQPISNTNNIIKQHLKKLPPPPSANITTPTMQVKYTKTKTVDIPTDSSYNTEFDYRNEGYK